MKYWQMMLDNVVVIFNSDAHYMYINKNPIQSMVVQKVSCVIFKEKAEKCKICKNVNKLVYFFVMGFHFSCGIFEHRNT